MKFKASSLLAVCLLVPGSIAAIHGSAQARAYTAIGANPNPSHIQTQEIGGKEGLLLAQGWSSLTPRQQQLDRNIRAVLKQTGRSSVPVNQQNVGWMMRQIGAQPQEANYVAQRMQLYVQVDSTL